MPEATPFYLWRTAQSGKSWLKRLLCERPAIAGLDEPHLMGTLFPFIVKCINHYNIYYYSGPSYCVGFDTPDRLPAARFCADTFTEAKFLLMICDGGDAMAASWYMETDKPPPHNLRNL